MEAVKDEVEYFTNQCYKEVKRVMMMDYDLARENFIDMGEMMLRMIYQVCLFIDDLYIITSFR